MYFINVYMKNDLLSETWRDVTDEEAKEFFNKYQREHEEKQGIEMEKKRKEWLLEKENIEKTWRTVDFLQKYKKKYKINEI